MAEERFSLKDHLFNADSIGDLAAEYSAALPGFDADGFVAEVLAGFADRELMARLDWIADCLEPRLPAAFPEMADALEAAMPAPLDPGRGMMISGASSMRCLAFWRYAMGLRRIGSGRWI